MTLFCPRAPAAWARAPARPQRSDAPQRKVLPDDFGAAPQVLQVDLAPAPILLSCDRYPSGSRRSACAPDGSSAYSYGSSRTDSRATSANSASPASLGSGGCGEGLGTVRGLGPR